MGLIRHSAIVLAVVLTLAGPVDAGDEGTSGAQFLRIGVGARAAGMGEAFCAVADDAIAIYWNPAGLVRISCNEATFTHIEWFQGIDYEFVGYAQPIGDSGGFGAGYCLLQTGEITKTLEDKWGVYAGEDGTFTVRDQALTVSYSHKLNESISTGMNLKLIHQDNAGKTASGYAFDFGSICQTPLDGLSLGLNLQNMGPKIKFISQADRLPFNIKLGGAYRRPSDAFTFAVDLNLPLSKNLDCNVGTEYWIRHIVALRAGYNSRLRGNELDSSHLGDGLSMGFGIIVKSLQLDAAYIPYGVLGHAYSASLLFRFGPQ
jgi:hypothetical protein